MNTSSINFADNPISIFFKKVDLLILAITIITMIMNVLYFEELFSLCRSESIHPLRDYYTNTGILIIQTIQLVLAFVLIIALVSKIYRKQKEVAKGMVIVLVLLSVTLAIIPWVEMWYGSTFYYGEVRDKQGLGFPVLSSTFMIYPFWVSRYKTHSISVNRFITRVLGSVFVIALLLVFYSQVYESWKLWQS